MRFDLRHAVVVDIVANAGAEREAEVQFILQTRSRPRRKEQPGSCINTCRLGILAVGVAVYNHTLDGHTVLVIHLLEHIERASGMTNGVGLHVTAGTGRDAARGNEVRIVATTCELGDRVEVVGEVVVKGPVPVLGVHGKPVDGGLTPVFFMSPM